MTAPKLIDTKIIAKNVFSGWLLMAFGMIFAFVTAPLYVKYLGIEQLGVMHLISGITTQFILFDFGIGNALTRYISSYRVTNDKSSIQAIFSSSMIMYLVISVVIMLVGWIMAINVQHIFKIEYKHLEIAKIYLMISCVTFALNMVKYPWVGIMSAYQEYRTINVIKVGRMFISAIGIIVLLKLHFGIIALALLSLFIEISTFPVYLYRVYRLMPNLSIRFKGINRQSIKTLTSFSIYTFIAIISQRLFDYFDDLVIGVFISTSSVAIYHYGYIMMDYIKKILSGINGVLLPVATTLHEDKNVEGLFKMFLLGSRFSFYISAPLLISLMFFGDHFFIMWLGESFHTSYLIFCILAVPNLFVITMSGGVQIIYAKNMHKTWSYFQFFNALLNLALSVTLLHLVKPQILGVAIGTSIPLTIYYFYMQHFYAKKIGFDMRMYIHEVLVRSIPAVIALLAVCVGLVIYNTPDEFYKLLINMTLSCSTFYFIIYKYNFKEDDKRYFRMIIKRS